MKKSYEKDTESIKNKKKNELLFWAIIIFIFAFSIRLIYLYNTKNEIWFDNPVLDAKYYNDWAQDIVRGDWLSKSKQELFMNPGYPYFLAIIYYIIGNNIFNAVLIQILLGSLSCILIYLIAVKYFSQKVGIIAGLLLSLYFHSVIYENKLLTVSLINFLNLLVLFLLTYSTEKPIHNIFTGLILGLSMSVRPNILLFAIFILFWVIISDTNKKYLICTFICLGISLIFILFMLRNYYVIGKFTPFVASSGINIYIGNNQDAEGSNIPPSFIKRFAPQTMEDEFVREASNRVGRNLTIGEANKYWLKQSLEFVKNNSKKYVSLFVKKILLLLYPIEITSNIWLDTKLSRFPFYNFIFPLGVCGMIISLKQWKKYLLLYLFIATYLISAILFFVISEYRFPIIPIIIVFTSFMIFWFYENIVEHNYSKAAIFILLVLMLFVIQRMTIKRLDIGNLSYVEHYNKAYIYVKEKMFDKAIIEYKLSLKDKPDYWDAWEGLGMVYLIVGMYDESTESFKKAIEIQPENAESVYYLKKANEMEKLRMGIRTLPLRPAKK